MQIFTMKTWFLFVKGGRWKIVVRKPAIQQQSRELRAVTGKMNNLQSHWGWSGLWNTRSKNTCRHLKRDFSFSLREWISFCFSTTNSYKFSSLTQMYYLSFLEARIWVQVSWVLCSGLMSNKAETLPQSWGLFPSSLVGGRVVISRSKTASHFGAGC